MLCILAVTDHIINVGKAALIICRICSNLWAVTEKQLFFGIFKHNFSKSSFIVMHIVNLTVLRKRTCRKNSPVRMDISEGFLCYRTDKGIPVGWSLESAASYYFYTALAHEAQHLDIIGDYGNTLHMKQLLCKKGTAWRRINKYSVALFDKWGGFFAMIFFCAEFLFILIGYETKSELRFASSTFP